MKAIEIDDDLYAFLLGRSIRIGEPATDILNRLLGRGAPTEASIVSAPTTAITELSDCVGSPRFQAKKDAVARFLHILGCVHDKDPQAFRKVLEIEGRSRKYFGGTRQELTQTGRSVQPRKVPGTNYWVVTNNDTPKKRRMIRDVLTVLGYPEPAIEEVVTALR